MKLSASLLALSLAVAAAPAPRVGNSLRSMVKPVVPKTVVPKLNNRNLKAKAAAPGYEGLSNMAGGIYDNVLFRNSAGWDPAQLAKDADDGKLKRFRESEIFHGRLGMMAVLGQVLAEKFHPFFQDAPHAGAHDQFLYLVDKYPTVLKLALAQVVVQEFIRSNAMFTNDDRMPSWHAKIGSMKDNSVPGAWGFDPLGLMPKTAEGKKQRQSQELNNGRLAMLAALGILAEEAKTGLPVADKIFGQ